MGPLEVFVCLAGTLLGAQTGRLASKAVSPAAAKPSEDAVLVGAGDIASCDDLAGAEATAKLIDKMRTETVLVRNAVL